MGFLRLPPVLNSNAWGGSGGRTAPAAETPPPPAQAQAPGAQAGASDPMAGMVAQLELASQLKGLCKMLDDADDEPDAPAAAPRPPVGGNPEDEQQLEGLLSGLLASLKTDAGREEFDKLATSQRADEAAAREADLAAKCPFPGFVPRPRDDDAPTAPPGVAVVEVGDAKGFVELLCADTRFKKTGE